jgi:hypothetical protein
MLLKLTTGQRPSKVVNVDQQGGGKSKANPIKEN